MALLSLAACEPTEGVEEPIEAERVGDMVEGDSDQPAETIDDLDGLETLEEIDEDVATPGDGPCEEVPEPIIAVSLAAAEGDDGGLLLHVSRTAESGEAPLLLTPALHSDDGSETHARVLLPMVSLSAGETIGIPTSITKLGLDLSGQEFSGRVEASASPQSDDLSASAEAVISEPLFFHPMSAQTYAVYDLGELAVHHGDYKGTLLDAGLDTGEVPPSRIVGQPKADKAEDKGDAVEYLKSDSPGQNEAVGTAGQIGPGGGDQGDPQTVATEQKTLCVKWYVQANDSSVMFRAAPSTPLSLEEDWGAGTGDDTVVNGTTRPGAYWSARNARFRMCLISGGVCGGWSSIKTLDANGCHTWTEPTSGSKTYSFEVRSEAQDVSGNLWRFSETLDITGTPVCPVDLFPYGSADCPATPGTHRTIVTAPVPLPNSSTVNVNVTGANQAEWSITAHTAAALYRLPSGLTNSEINLCLSSDGGSQNYANVFSARRGCIEMGSSTQARRKFGVAHELGHAVGYLYAADDFNGATLDYDAEYEKDGLSNEPATCTPIMGGPPEGPPTVLGGVSEYVNDVGQPVRISDAGECYAPCTNYGLWSYEWNSLALREAFAHTYATHVMNDRARDAIFVSARGNEAATSPSTSLVRLSLDDDADGIGTGGRLEVTCCESGFPTGCRTNVGTIRDWTGALWNWYASSWDELCAPGNPGAGTVEWIDVLNVFDATLAAHTNSGHKQQGWNFFTSAVGTTSGLPGCADDTWASVGATFGIDN